MTELQLDHSVEHCPDRSTCSRHGTTLTALGRPATEFARFDTISTPPSIERVTLITDDFTAICPVTAQRDFYSVIASYIPNRVCLETKTWRLYLAGFADRGMFCEALAHKICSDLWGALEPHDMRVSLTQRMHGGTVIKAHAHLSRLPATVPPAPPGGNHASRHRS